MDKFLKILDFVLVIAAIVLAVYVGKNIGLEYLMRGREEPVTLSMTEGGLPEDYIGRPASGDIPLIEDGHSWEEAWATDYITIQPVGIVSTGVGALHPWVDAYTTPTRRNRGGWKAPVITNTALDVFNEYGEFYLLQLPDESYILAQLPMEEARKLKMGKKSPCPSAGKYRLICRRRAALTESAMNMMFPWMMFFTALMINGMIPMNSDFFCCASQLPFWYCFPLEPHSLCWQRRFSNGRKSNKR